MDHHPPGPVRKPSQAICYGRLCEVSCHRLATNAGHRFTFRNTSLGATVGQILVLVLKCQWRLLSSSGRLKLVRRGSGERRSKREEQPWGCYLFCGSRCQWKISVRIISAVRTFGAGTITNVSDKCFCTDSSRWVITFARRILTPCCPHFWNIFLLQVLF
jgi:hypothetical protein